MFPAGPSGRSTGIARGMLRSMSGTMTCEPPRQSRGLTRRWIGAAPHNASLPENVAGSVSPPPLVQRVLQARGLNDAEEIARFCEPRLTDLHDPGLMPGID